MIRLFRHGKLRAGRAARHATMALLVAGVLAR
jgi:hypothetical protein